MKYSVSDTGRGISKQKKKELFQFLDPEMYQYYDLTSTNEPETTSLGGTGLGISQKIAKEFGSKLEFTSTLNVGSTFWFTIDISEVFGFLKKKVEVKNDLLTSEDNNLAHNVLRSSRIHQEKWDQPILVKRSSFSGEVVEDKFMNIKSNHNPINLSDDSSISECKHILFLCTI